MQSTSRMKLGAKSVLLTSILSSTLFLQTSAQAALSFSFDYSNNPAGVGFLDSVYGADRRQALEDSASLLGAYFTNYTANLTYSVKSLNNAGSSTLASAGSGVVNSVSSGFGNTIVQEKILNGVDDNGSDADGSINWNFSHSWDLDDSISPTAFDFKSTAMHELLHSFGFSAAMGGDGSGLLTGITVGTDPDVYSTFDRFLSDGSGNKLVNNAGVFQSSELSDLTGGTGNNGVFFDGANAVAANGGDLVNIFSPDPYDNGSSLAHLDDEFFTSDALLMEAATVPGTGTRTLSGIEIGVLKDIGYTNISAVPEASTYTMMTIGIMMLGSFSRKRKS